MWRDKSFWLAVVAALVYWPALYLYSPTAVIPGWPLAHPWLFISLCLLYPVMEEVVFRGLIQDGVHKYLKRPAWYAARLPLSHANLFTSLLFTAFHFINHPAVWAALVFIPSIIFGHFKDRHNSLTPPIFLHIWYNLGYFWIFGAPLASISRH